MQVQEAPQPRPGVWGVSYSRLLWLVLGLGALVRLVLAFDSNGVVFDLQSYVLVKDALRHDFLNVYAGVNSHLFRWPYPSGFFPFIATAAFLAKLTGLAFTSLIRVPAILADLAIAWIVQDFVGRRGASDGVRLTAAAAVALGPLFVAVSGYHGQIDSLAMLPAVAAVALWHRLPLDRRALVAGALIGVGGTIKSVPLLMIVALLPSCRSVREGATVIAAAAGVMALAIAPFLIADPHGVQQLTNYHSLYGLGGLSLLVQPDLARAWLAGVHVHFSAITNTFQGHLGQVVIVATVGSAALLVLRLRKAPVPAAALLWLTVFAFSVNWGPRYAVWGLPFFVMAGYIRTAMALQLALMIPSVLIYAAPVSDATVKYVYVPVMLAVLGMFAVADVVAARRMLRGRAVDRHSAHLQPI